MKIPTDLSMNKFSFFILLIFMFFQACDEPKKDPDTTTTENQSKQLVLKAPAFNADSAYSYVAAQVKFGPRIPNTVAHVKCGDYMIALFKKYGATVIAQEFQAKGYDNKILRSRNIIASLNPKATKRIILAAHWDTRPWADEDTVNPSQNFDGANDGASGAGVLIEMARVMNESKEKPAVGIDIILFDSEDYGKSQVQDSYCLGSQYWAKNKHVPNYTAYYGILLDMVGAQNARFNKESLSMEYAPSIVNKVWDKASAIGYSQYFIHQQAGSITDDHYYVNKLAGIPMIDIIDYDPSKGFGSYWHTHSDDMKVIDKNTLKAVGQTLLEVVYNE